MDSNVKKIGFVLRGINKGGGVERFVKNLLFSMDKMVDQELIRFVVISDRKYDFLDDLQKIDKVFIKKYNKLFWDNFLLFRRIKKENFDCVIYPKNVIAPTNFFLRCKKYIIIHDLAYFKEDLNAYKFWDAVYMKTLMGISCRKADHIFSISNFTKREITKFFNIRKDKITVIHEGVEKEFRKIDDQEILDKVRAKYGLQLPFIFYPGSISPRKNVIRALKAFNEIKNDISHILYFTGSRGWSNKDVWKFIQDNKLEERVKKIGYVSDEELSVLYNLADLCLYPSLYEGFGLPILEAQACGCPVLTSNVSSCPEVAGKGAYIVNPYSEKEIIKGMKMIIDNADYREKMIERGFDNLKRYNWKDTAKKILREF